jgi:hypothetical protein
VSCNHARVQRFELGHCTDVICVDCDHTWAEYPGELEFAAGQIAGLAFALLTPRDERRPEWILPGEKP